MPVLRRFGADGRKALLDAAPEASVEHRCSCRRSRAVEPMDRVAHSAGPAPVRPSTWRHLRLDTLPHVVTEATGGVRSMKTFPTAKIRNVALVGHGGAGKTTLAEALLLRAGAINRLGRVEDGTTVVRLRPRGAEAPASRCRSPGARSSGRATRSTCSTRPGYADFVGDVAAALRVADLAVFVVSAVEGVEVQTEVGLADGRRARPPPHDLRQQARPRAGRRSRARSTSCSDRFGAGVAPLELPIGEEAGFRGVVDLLTDTAYVYDGRHGARTGADPRRDGGAGARGARRPGRGHRRRRRRPDGALPRRRGPVASRSSSTRWPTASRRPRVFPVCAARPPRLIGIDRLADFICEIGPSPLDRPPVDGRGRRHDVEVAPDADGRAARVRVQDDRRPLRRPA